MLQNKPQDKNSEKKDINIYKAEMFSGPLPHPKILQKYEAVEQGLANRIVKMAEDQENHRQKIEKQLVTSATRT